MKKLLAILLALGLLASPVIAAESITQSLQGGPTYMIMKMVWVTDGSGDLTATDTAYSIDGIVLLAETVPTASISPAALYDITLTSPNGIDVFGGALGNRSATAAEHTMPLLNSNYSAVPVYGALELDVTNAGATKGGTIYIHFLKIMK